jgi:hypothetical protein
MIVVILNDQLVAFQYIKVRKDKNEKINDRNHINLYFCNQWIC